MTTSQLSRLADLRDRFKGSTLVVPTPARIHGADWVVKSVVLGVNVVVAYPKDSPGEPQMVDFSDVFLPGDTMWRQRGGRGSTETSWHSQNEASARANLHRQAPKVGPVDHLDLGICGCDGIQSEEACQRRAPLGLVAHPAGGEKTLRCQRFQAELEQRRVVEAARPAPPPKAARPSRAVYMATPGLTCSKCGRADGAKLSGANTRVKVDLVTKICSLHHGGTPASMDGESRQCSKCRSTKPASDFSPGQSWCRLCKRELDREAYAAKHPARPAEQDQALPPAAPAASSAPAETPEKGLPEPAALTAPAQPAVPPLGAQASADPRNEIVHKTPPEIQPAGSLLDQIDQLIRERRQLRTENAELRARLEVADDLERQLAGIRDRVERELANV